MVESAPTSYSILQQLEEEAIYVIREAWGQFKRPVVLFSGGKDSVVLTHLVRRAFTPFVFPVPLLHIDTGHNFPETIDFRDRFAEKMGADLLIRKVQDSINLGRATEATGATSRNSLQSITLTDAIEELDIDCALGGARRDEEKARAKERFFSVRSTSGAWRPECQRPELWRHLDGSSDPGERHRVFPLNNWTELDIWEYIAYRRIELPSLYFAHEREVFDQAGILLAQTEHNPAPRGEIVTTKSVRFRTVGDSTCTGAIPSQARTVKEVLLEVRNSRHSERSGRADDHSSDAAMEDRKKQGYF